MRKISCLVIFFAAISCQIFAQSKEGNAAKYEQLRNRLRNEFVYYTGNGMDRGSSLVMQGRNNRIGYWADATWWQGHYIAMLATEYARLKRDGESTDATLKELHCAVDAYVRLDLNAEHCWGCDTFTQCNGFYLRDDIDKCDTVRFGLRDLDAGYENHCGNTSTTSNTPSQDQVWGSYLGFALVQALVDDSLLCQKVADICYLMVTDMQGTDENGKQKWQIVNPVNNMLIQSNMDIQWLQYPHTVIGEKISGRPLAFKGSDKASWRNMWHIVLDNMLIDQDGNFRWYGILCMASVMNDERPGNRDCYAWLVKVCNKIAQRRTDMQQTLIFPHLPLINLVLYGTDGRTLVERGAYDAYLDTAPEDGAITRVIDGQRVRTAAPWNTLSLFCPWRTRDIGEGNMLDYLLLYNLVELIYGE